MVQAGTLFEYLAAFITIVLGLALADLLISFHRLLRARRRLIWRPFPLILALYVFLTLLTGFFELWEMTRWDSITYPRLVWEVLLYVPFFLAACAVLPDDLTDGTFDLDHFHLAERNYIVTLLVVGLILNCVDTTVTKWEYFEKNPNIFVYFYLPVNLLALLGLSGIGWGTRKWVQWLAFAILLGSAFFGYIVWEVRGLPALPNASALP